MEHNKKKLSVKMLTLKPDLLYNREKKKIN